MSVFSSIKNSLLSGTNENNVSLANIKFDFALLKVEAPSEFKPLGAALSPRRRDEAEHGPQHKTARRLAALFEQLIPNTPRLISAYGKRVSEIIETPGINPVGQASHGPFKEFIGADGTAAWAAATSGRPALGIYLLACLLARAWDSKESTAIWVELVSERQREIKEQFENNHPVSEGSIASSFQQILREDLRLWDASARSWLRSADQAKQRNHDQLFLILNNINIPFTRGSSLYEKVISTWKKALAGIEELLSGRPQSISCAGVLLALSSWHLYPDLIVLGSKTVSIKFEDSMLPSTGVCTIGLQITSPERDGGVQWSLALSHLRYYGAPVDVTSSPDASRVTISQLSLIAFGGLLGTWGVNWREFEAAAKLLSAIGDIIRNTLTQHDSRLNPGSLLWIQPLIQASRIFLVSPSSQKEEIFKLMKYGQRRAKPFLQKPNAAVQPYFGLCNSYVLSGLSASSDIECAITYLRGIAKSVGYSSSDCMIVHSHWVGRNVAMPTAPDYLEFMTAVAHDSVKRDSEGQEISQAVHARWFYTCSEGSKPERQNMTKSSVEAHIGLLKRTKEQCFVLCDTAVKHSSRDIAWTNPPRLFSSCNRCGLYAMPDPVIPMSDTLRICQCFEPIPSVEGSGSESTCHFTILCGSRYLGLFKREPVQKPGELEILRAQSSSIGPSAALQHLTQNPICNMMLVHYLSSITPEFTDLLPGVFVLAKPCSLPKSLIDSLNALYSAILVYRSLEATISIRIVSERLGKAKWAPENPHFLSRAQAFACIIHLDSGKINLDSKELDHVLAVCTQNSIFVTARALSDPLDSIKPYDIRRLVGNIGKSGISMLVSPSQPQIRDPRDDYHVVNHHPYDFKREDNFQNTSLHLSFTNWSLPLETVDTRTIDQDLRFVESVISVRDRGAWVADLDILKIKRGKLMELESTSQCHGHRDDELRNDYVSVDSWDEVLDLPPSVGIFRAHGNWVARLAVTCILFQKGLGDCTALFDRKKFCLKCLEHRSGFPGAGSLESVICID